MRGLEFSVSEKQAYALECLNDPCVKQVLYGGSANSGKTQLACIWLLTMCLKYPGTKWLAGRNGLTILKNTTIASLVRKMTDVGMSNGSDYDWHPNSSCLKFNNGSSIVMYDLSFKPSDPNLDDWGGLELTGALIEEASSVNNAIYDNIAGVRVGRWMNDKYSLPGRILLTCNPGTNFTYTKFYKPWKDGSLASHLRFVQALPEDMRVFGNDDVIDNMKNNTDKVRYNRYYLGNWEYDDDPSSLVSYDNIIQVFNNNHIETSLGTKLRDGKELTEVALTVDPAYQGGDSTVILAWKGLKVVDHFEYSGKQVTLEETEKEIFRLQQKHSVPSNCIIIDVDGGWGNSLSEKFKGSHRYKNGGSPVSKDYDISKSECMFKLADVINNGELWIDIDDADTRERIVLELQQLKRAKLDSDSSKLSIVKKSVMKEGLRGKSPDFLDALSMRMFPLVNPKPKPEHRFYIFND